MAADIFCLHDRTCRAQIVYQVKVRIVQGYRVAHYAVPQGNLGCIHYNLVRLPALFQPEVAFEHFFAYIGSKFYK